MRKIIVLILIAFASRSFAQNGSRLFGKDPIINFENFQKKGITFGFYLGFNSYDFKIDYKKVSKDIQTTKNLSFNVGLVADLRLHEYFNLRFEPGLYNVKRDLHYPVSYFQTTPNSSNILREVNSTYLHFPLLLKFSSLRTGNIRPYLLGGVSAALNLSSNSKSIDDNYQERFRLNSWSRNYELGFGIDIYSEYFIFSPSIRGVFGLNNELIPDNNPNSPWTGNIETMKTRGILINFTFQ